MILTNKKIKPARKGGKTINRRNSFQKYKIIRSIPARANDFNPKTIRWSWTTRISSSVLNCCQFRCCFCFSLNLLPGFRFLDKWQKLEKRNFSGKIYRLHLTEWLILYYRKHSVNFLPTFSIFDVLFCLLWNYSFQDNNFVHPLPQ